MTLKKSHIVSAFSDTLVGAHRKLTADPGALLVDAAEHRLTIQRRTPAIVQARHHLPAPAIGLYEFARHTCLANEHHFETAATGLAV